MIKSRKDYQYYLQQDKVANLGETGRVRFFIEWLYGTDAIKAYCYLKTLRKFEFALNCYPKSFWGNLGQLYFKWKHHKACEKYNIVIGPNMIGYGFRIAHVTGGGRPRT